MFLFIQFIIPLCLEFLAAVSIGTAIYLLKDFFSNKKTLLTGPTLSGKTTFLRYISKDEIPDGPSGAPRTFKVKDAIFDEVTDLGGAEGWLYGKFDTYIKEHDYVLFFFDISEYLRDEEYREDSNARLDMIYRNAKSQNAVLLVGTHIDKVSGNYKANTEGYFAGKPYQSLLSRIVYIDTTQKECVKTILDELKK